jgi:bifunctional non-homologous end joining protein LigD
MPENENIRISEDFKTSATEFLEAASNMGLEGIIAKKEDSEYHPGERTRDWLKIKANQRHEVVIGGFTRNEEQKKHSALCLLVFMKMASLNTPVKLVPDSMINSRLT